MVLVTDWRDVNIVLQKASYKHQARGHRSYGAVWSSVKRLRHTHWSKALSNPAIKSEQVGKYHLSYVDGVS